MSLGPEELRQSSARSTGRDYRRSRRRRLGRHLRAEGPRALLAGVTGTGVLAGFLSASYPEQPLPLLAYIGIAAAASGLVLLILALPPGFRLPGTVAAGALLAEPDWHEGSSRPRPLPAVGPVSLRRRIAVDDPVYAGGLRALLAPERPLVVISSNRRDVGLPHELPLPLFAEHGRRTQVEIDLREFGIPLAAYGFGRERPEGGQDTDHTLAVKDLVYVPELAAALTWRPDDGGRVPAADGSPVMLPEHCVDPVQLSRRDVVVVGGPDTNFWHGALFEPVARDFTVPAGRVPLALDLRDTSGSQPVYGSRSISVQLCGLGSVFEHTREDRAELDERLYPTYGMVLATRNPFAAAVGRSHWCVFVAGTRSLGTCASVLGLTRMLRAMQADPGLNFFSAVPSSIPGAAARVSAVLFRAAVVEQSMLRRGGQLGRRTRRTLPPSGPDPQYSDSYVPMGVEYLAYPAENADAPTTPRWTAI